MADTLFDALQKKLSGQDNELTLAPQQNTIAANLAAKSGKAVPTDGSGGTPAASTVTQDAATAQANTQLAQANQAARAQGAQIASEADLATSRANFAKDQLAARGQVDLQNIATQGEAASERTAAASDEALSNTQFTEDQKVDQLNATASNKLADMASQYGTSVDNIFRNFQQSSQELAFRNDGAALEQAGFMMAMQDKAYLTEITRVGQERQLDDKLNYSEELQRVVLGDDLDRAMQNMGWKDMMSADQRTFNAKITNLGTDEAIAVANAAIAQASQTQMWSGVGTVTSGVAQYAVKKADEKDKPADATPADDTKPSSTIQGVDYVHDSPGTPLAGVSNPAPGPQADYANPDSSAYAPWRT